MLRRGVALLAVVIGVAGCSAGVSVPATTSSPGARGTIPCRSRFQVRSCEGLAPASASLRTAILLSSQRVIAGELIKGTLVVTNSGNRAIDLVGPRGCNPSWDVVLTNRTWPPVAAFAAQCTEGPFPIKPGTNRFAISVRSTYISCSQASTAATASQPACLPGPKPPPIPAGHYFAVLLGSGGLALPPPRPVAVTLEPAAKAALGEVCGVTALSGGLAIDVGVQDPAQLRHCPSGVHEAAFFQLVATDGKRYRAQLYSTSPDTQGLHGQWSAELPPGTYRAVGAPGCPGPERPFSVPRGQIHLGVVVWWGCLYK